MTNQKERKTVRYQLVQETFTLYLFRKMSIILRMYYTVTCLIRNYGQDKDSQSFQIYNSFRKKTYDIQYTCYINTYYM